MGKIIGIDLGTTNSAAAVMQGGKPTIVPSAEGATAYGKAFPSYVAFTKDGQLLVGEPARRQAATNTENTVHGIKRKMGTNEKVTINGKKYTPQEISAFILQKIKRDAEAFLGEPVEKAVITVPAYFNDNQRQATKDAGKIAGLEVIRLVNEPTAASLAYGLDKKDKEQKIMVFDFGGGTLDVTIMDFGEGVFEVLSTSGDTVLGGRDMDEKLMDYIIDEFKKDSGVDIRNDNMALQRLREAAEKAKIELSNVMTTDINLPFITADQNGPKHLTMNISRAKLEELVRPIVEKCKQPIEQAIADAKLKKSDIDKIILVGGPTRMPIVQKFVEDFVGKKVERGIDPMECVAMGAAIQAGVIAGDVKDILLLDVTPLSLGVETEGGIMTTMIERNTTIPTKKNEIFSTAADNQNSVEIHVLQGERPLAKDNVSLGKFHLMGIPPAPRGIPKIEVTFDIDKNGILNVSAKDLGTGKEQKITITSSTKLSDDEIDKMVKEAKEFEEKDKEEKERIELMNQAESLIYSTERLLKENKDKIPESEAKSAQEFVDKLKKAKEEGDVEKIKSIIEELQEALNKASTKMYENVGKNEDNVQDAAPGQKAEGDVEDAEYKIVDDDEK